MRLLRLILASAALMFAAGGAYAAEPKEGVDYQLLTPAVPTEAAGKKVEVIEFFMFTCPHCFAMEPALSAWVKKNADKVNFRRIHFPRGEKDPLAHAYITLETMGKLEGVSDKIFSAIHIERKRLSRDDDVTDIIVKAGVDKTKYLEVFNSFAVQTKMKRANQLIAAYKVDSAPTLVIDGRYVTSPSMAGRPNQPEAQSQMAALAVADYLVAKAASTKK